MVYGSGREFLEDVSGHQRRRRRGSPSTRTPTQKQHKDEPTEEEESVDNDDDVDESYTENWRLEMVLGQTEDALALQDNPEGTWMAVWSGEDENSTRLLE